MITDLIRFTVKPDCAERAIEHMRTQTLANRDEAGCIMSHVFRGRDNPSELYMLLQWADEDAVKRHLATEHDAQFRTDMDGCIARPPEFFDWDKII